MLYYKVINKQKPFWQTDVFVVLALVIFWPAGLFLMWKYAGWKGWVKGVLTFFFVLGAIPSLLIWSLILGLKGYLFIDNFTIPKVINQSQLYNCAPINSEWGKCTNSKYGFSFEYPASWNYIDKKPEGIGFGPSEESIRDSFVIAVGSPEHADTEEKAKETARFAGGDEININSLYATEKETSLNNSPFSSTVKIVHGTNVSNLTLLFGEAKKANLTYDEIKTIFKHMINSFKIEK